jgi:nicotinic acid mononucleotide adenylyltransferase
MHETFEWTKPTVMMLGRWQPWHDGHQTLFKKAVEITGQVCIMLRHIDDPDNPFDINQRSAMISMALAKDGYYSGQHYTIMAVPNIVNISYGRGVGYTFTEHDLGDDIHNISATKIREEMRKEGKL